MEIQLKKDTKQTIEDAKLYCKNQGLEIVFTHEISEDVMNVISKRSKDLPSLYFASKDMLKARLENGCYLLKKNGIVFGHIFAHKHMVLKYAVYERSSLWIHPSYRNHNLGLLLMHLLTKKFNKDFLISIAQKSAVHKNNELLGMQHITLSEISMELIKTLEEIGKLRDEYKYKYYVNPYFELKIKQFNKILGKAKK